MLILQIEQLSTGLLQYGVLGIFCLLLISVVISLRKAELQNRKEVANELAEMKKEMRDYWTKDRHIMIECIRGNSEALKELKDAFKDVREELKALHRR
jgi:sugar-specific transcriptional regulator TrmB